jgi:hypothetical protein
MTSVPSPCNHYTYVKMNEARWVYGTPGIIPARYRCTVCGMEWDDPTELPDTSRVWSKGGPLGMHPS